MLGLFKYKTQRSNIAFALSWGGMVVILVSFAILLVSMPPKLYQKPNVGLYSVPSIILAILVFVFGYWLTCIFPTIKITDKGIQCKRMYFYISLKWREMDNMIELKNGMMALTIKRKGWSLLNGLFFEWLTSKALRQKHPVILFTPEFFGGDKTIPQQIIANTPAESGVNAYLNEKIKGTGFINPSRFSIQDSDNSLLITIPGKKNIFEILFLPIALYLSYIGGYSLYLFGLVNFYFTLSLSQASWDSRTLIFFIIMDIISFLFICFLLFWIFYVFASTLRHMAGNEIVGLNGQSLTITKQIFGWKRMRTYSVDSVKDLRVEMIKPNLLIILYQALQAAMWRNGVIVFDYNGKSVRFGLDISEDEGGYFLTKIKSWMKP